MKKLFTFLLLGCAGLIGTQAQGVYQIPNSDFEDWAADNEPGNGWNSFASARTTDLGGLGGIAKGMSPNPSKVEGYNSTYAVFLKSKSVAGKKANGNLTTGRINMGSMTPENSANYNFTDLTATTHSLLFAGTPDAVSFYAKFKSGGSENGRGQFILHDEYAYRDPETSNDAGYESHKIGTAVILVPQTEEWTYFEAPFEYTGVATPEKQYMLASLTTNPIPGGSADDELTVDCIRIIYNSELATLTYDDENIFVKGKTAYDLSDKAYDASLLTCTSNGRAATIEQSYKEATGLLTITVKGDDWSEENLNQHVYTIQFKTAVTTNYTNGLSVGINGEYTAPQETTIQLIEQVDGTYSFVLKNFYLDVLAVGNIQLDNLSLVDGKISTSQGIAITAGDDPDVDWFGPKLTLMSGGSIPVELSATVYDEENMTAEIAIDMTKLLDQMINVTFAPPFTLNSSTSIGEETSNLYNVEFSRSFPAGWSTICLPFATTVEALGATQAQEFTDFANNTLEFTKVSTGKLEANTPYLIHFEQAKDLSAAPIYAPMTVESSTPKAVTFGDVTFTGNYTASMSMKGYYGVADQNGSQYIMKGGSNSTLGSTGAYFSVAGAAAEVNRLALDLEGVTAIGSVETEGAEDAFDVYSISGVKVRTGATNLDGLQRGLYIVNGKKVLVK